MWCRVDPPSRSRRASSPRRAGADLPRRRRNASRAALLAALATGTSLSCALFATLDPNARPRDPNAQATAAAEEERARHTAEQAERDRLVAASIAEARARANAPGRAPSDVAGYGQAVVDAHAQGMVERGQVDGAAERREAIAALEGARGEDPETLAERRAIELDLRLLEGDSLGAAQLLASMFEDGPSLEVMAVATALPRTPETTPIVIDICKGARRLVQDDEGVSVVVERCLPWVDGVPTSLPWKSARRDVAVYERLLAQHRIEAEQRAAAERAEAERMATEQAAAARAAEEAASRQARLQTAGCFAAGRCRFNDCFKNGWDSSTSEGTTRTMCRFSKCLSDGWETTFPDGTRANTRCLFGKCFSDGWETTFSDGTRARTRCLFGRCESDGWETTYPDGSSSRTRCSFGKCLTEGWVSSHPDGTTTKCRCNFRDCAKNGAICD